MGRIVVMEDRLMNDKEAARYLGLSKKWGYMTVQKWVRQGLIRAGRVGDLYRFRRQDLDDFVFSKR